MDKFVCVDSVLKKILRNYGISEELEKLYSIWEQVIGTKLAKKIQLCGIKKDVLLVTVDTSAHHHYLKLHKKEWLQKINSFLSSEKQKIVYNDIKVIKL
mgnify:CR=1 FL=1